MRAWCPPGGAAPASGSRIRIYVSGGETHGWCDEASGLAVDQRRFDGRVAPAVAELVCKGDCKMVWTAPAATAILAAGDPCARCRGALAPA
jgi:hypothetical protein